MGCKYCDEDRLINQGAIWFGDKGKIACLNSNNELVVNINGEQVNIPVKFCPWCGCLLNSDEDSAEQLRAKLRDKDNEINDLRELVKYLKQFEPKDKQPTQQK